MISTIETKKFEDEIARLKDLRQKLIQRTVEELDTYENSLESKFEERLQEAHLPLIQEISSLKAVIAELENEKSLQTATLNEFKQRAHHYHHQLQQVVQVGSSLLDISAPPMTPVAPNLSPAPVPVPIVLPPDPESPVLKKKKKQPLRTLVRRSLSFSVLIGLSYFGWQAFSHFSTQNRDQAVAGQVAGASTDPNITHPTQASSDSSTPGQSDSYPESLADVPFADTQWEQNNDPDFGINIAYPHNTSNRIHLPGGNNLWFLRKNSYMLKITKEETTQQLDQWIDTNKSDFADYTLSKGSFKNIAGWVGEPLQKTENSGTFYIVRHGINIYQIWIKNFPENSDDGQRIKKMVNSLVFTN